MAKLAPSRPALQPSQQHGKQKGLETNKARQQLEQHTAAQPVEEQGEGPPEQNKIGTMLEDKIDKAIKDLEFMWKDGAISQWKQTRRLRKTQQLLPVLDSHTKALACLQGSEKRCVGQWRRMAKVTRIIKRSDKLVKMRS